MVRLSPHPPFSGSEIQVIPNQYFHCRVGFGRCAGQTGLEGGSCKMRLGIVFPGAGEMGRAL